ncbi:sensor histidine kinase [Mesorhizobium sp. A623]
MISEAGDGHKAHAGDEIVALPAEREAQLDRALLHALRNAGISVLYQDRTLKIVWSRNMRTPLATEETAGGAMTPMQGERIDAARRDVLASGNPLRLEINVPGPNGLRWFEIWIDADRDDDGSIVGVVTTKVEMTEQKRREQTLKTLLREVSHRSKNLLAIIQSIATQTGRYSDTLAEFLARFRGRLHSLSSSQDLVTSSNWRGAELHELVSGQVSRYGANPKQSLRFSGDNPYLNPNAALHIGLAMHELAVNSVSYGALSQPDGFVEITARLLTSDTGEKTLSLVWIEIVGINTRHEHKKFGSVALERIVPSSLNGTSSLEIVGGRLEYRLTVPQGNFETD